MLEFTTEQESFRSVVREFAESEIRPYAEEFIEKQNRKESLVVKFSDGSPPPLPSEDLFSYDMYRLSDPSYNLHLYDEKSSLKDYQKNTI